MSYIYAVIPVILTLILAAWALRAYRIRKRLGAIVLRGFHYGTGRVPAGFLGIFSMTVFLQSTDWWGRYFLAAVPVVLMTYIQEDLLGEYGLKANLVMIPREELLDYQWVEGRKNTVAFFTGKYPEGIRFQLSKKAAAKAEQSLKSYFAGSPDQPDIKEESL